ncbi:MAG: hypothetical protein ACC726_08365 [Chloroflexota bacterium]
MIRLLSLGVTLFVMLVGVPIPALASADCQGGPVWPSVDRARGTTFKGVFEGATTTNEERGETFHWTVERVYACPLTPGPLDGWGIGNPGCHPTKYRQGRRYLVSSQFPGGADAFDTIAYELLAGGRVRIAPFPMQPRSSAPRVFKVGTLREALDLLVPGTPRKDSGVARNDTFALTIETDRPRVVAGEPIAIATTLRYIGTAKNKKATVSGAGGGLVAFGVEQFDGPIDTGPGWRPSCGFYRFQPDEILGVTFKKSGGFDAGDPMADFWRAWFADPVLRLPEGNYVITAYAYHGGRGAVCTGPWQTLSASVPIEVVAAPNSPASVDVSAAPAPSKSPVATKFETGSKPTVSSAPTDDPFPWPILTPPSDVPLPPALQPNGPPDASTTKHGIRVELWLSTRTAIPGEWVQAVVKSTNLRDTPAWSMPFPCEGSGTVVTVDPRAGIPSGVEQQGNAAVLKRKAVRRGPYLWDGFVRRKDALRWVTSSAGAGPGRAFVECTGPSEPRRLGPRATVTERFAWYPTSSFDEGERFQPLWPRIATATVSWPFLGRGDEPSGSNQDLWRRIKRIKTTANIEIGGDGPGTPSIPELVDSALADPRFRAWVDEDPTRKSWNGVSWLGASGPTYPHNLASIGLQDAPPNGLLWLELDRNNVQRGVVTLDPWTGEVLRVHCLGPSLGRPCRGPTVFDEALE